MAKSKNHTNHNQNKKAHKGGIMRPQRQRYSSLCMVNQKRLRNLRRARKFDPSIKKSANLQKRINFRIANKAKIQAAIKQSVVARALRN